MNDNSIDYLNGLLTVASAITGDTPFTETWRANFFEITEPDLLDGYKQHLLNLQNDISAEETELEYSFSEPVLIKEVLPWLEKRFERELLGKFQNSEYIIWKIVDEISMLNDWEKFEDSHFCEMSDGIWEGYLILIPIKNNLLALFFGCLTEEERKSGKWPVTPPVKVSRENDILKIK